jgi:glycosyltransferase involved in cell wall biosynthesis
VARVLVLTELLPYPLVSGAKIRIYYVLRQLASRHQVTLLSFVRPDDRPEYIEHLRSFLSDVQTVPIERSRLRDVRAAVLSLLTGRPAIILREEIGAMRRRVEALLAEGSFDIVHADQIPMAQYGLLGQGTAIRRLLDQHNATFQIIRRLAENEPSTWKRLLLKREAEAFRRYEVEVCPRFDHVTFVTDADRQTLLKQMGERPLVTGQTTVIPICVDTESVPPVEPVAEPFRVTHVGTMYWPPNVEGMLWFWREVWPEVQSQFPGARLTLIGKNPPVEIEALDARPGVDVPGFVEDLTPYLAETAAFIVPLHAAGGMRVKIVDAWCWAMPIVSTTIGAEGIDVRSGENLLIADTPADFAQALVRILARPELQRALRARGRGWVESHYDWRRMYPAWDDVYDRLLSGLGRNHSSAMTRPSPQRNGRRQVLL